MQAHSVRGLPQLLVGGRRRDVCPLGQLRQVGILQVPPVPSPIISESSKGSLLRLTVSKGRAQFSKTRLPAMIRPTEEGRMAARLSMILPSISMTLLLSPTMVRPAQRPKTPLVTAGFIWRLIMTGKPRNTVGPEQPATPAHYPVKLLVMSL